jgi:molybdopterin-containing oxidoreductase family membrane subunit
VLCFQVLRNTYYYEKVSKLEAYITIHIELMNIVIMITGSIVGVAYITELFIAWYSGVEYEHAFLNRATAFIGGRI